MKSVVKKWILGIFSIILLVDFGVYFHFQSEINHVLGAHTEIIDTSQFKTISGKLAITNVNILSTNSEVMIPNQTVLVEDKKIIAIHSDSIPVANDFHKIDGHNKYLIPGLIDSHVHLKKSKNDLLLYIANGITHVGEMTGMKEHFEYQKEIDNGAIGPNIYIASPKLSSQKGMKANFRSWMERRHQNYTTPKAARKAVHYYKNKGYKAIKLSSDLNKTNYYAVIDEAKKINIPVIGHLPIPITLEELYTSGQSQLSHVESITYASMLSYGRITSKNADDFLKHLEGKADHIAVKLQENNITISTTVATNKSVAKQAFHLADYLKTIALEYQNPGWVEGSSISKGWLPGNNSYEYSSDLTEKQKTEVNAYLKTFTKALDIVTKALVRNNVVITAGTDANGAAGAVPGFSLHEELVTLSEIGLTNAEILKATTSATADWMNETTGKIEVDYRADLVLLNKNPLENIRNSQSIEAVITNGKYLNRLALNNILKAVKNANNRSRKINIDKYLK
ncbi:amidohydrolase family protein [uncultured Tenacibaculum sp.]|uniref:amidohydrolase family protein n=1 Tax=uncultured Tenacibaculum sp. TaxID=174713 RepID=UPI0026030EC5|nr:amidohydrolase family protein [uncultured Tenacibaculum sp.]